MRSKVQRDGFNKDQETKLRSKKRSRIPLTEEEKWKAVWQILFPNDTEDDIPSPCKFDVLLSHSNFVYGV